MSILVKVNIQFVIIQKPLIFYYNITISAVSWPSQDQVYILFLNKLSLLPTDRRSWLWNCGYVIVPWSLSALVTVHGVHIINETFALEHLFITFQTWHIQVRCVWKKLLLTRLDKLTIALACWLLRGFLGLIRTERNLFDAIKHQEYLINQSQCSPGEHVCDVWGKEVVHFVSETCLKHQLGVGGTVPDRQVEEGGPRHPVDDVAEREGGQQVLEQFSQTCVLWS